LKNAIQPEFSNETPIESSVANDVLGRQTPVCWGVCLPNIHYAELNKQQRRVVGVNQRYATGCQRFGRVHLHGSNQRRSNRSQGRLNNGKKSFNFI
jgi:hypothetical protein